MCARHYTWPFSGYLGTKFKSLCLHSSYLMTEPSPQVLGVGLIWEHYLKGLLVSVLCAFLLIFLELCGH